MDVVALADRPAVQADEGISLVQLARGAEMSLQYFRIDPGAELPLHSHHHEQAGFLDQGAVTFVFEDETERVVEAGESYVIPGDVGHATVNRGSETATGLDVFSPPRESLDWAEDTYHRLLE
jgi:quercetin dioxygenase-like cupin family protein